MSIHSTTELFLLHTLLLHRPASRRSSTGEHSTGHTTQLKPGRKLLIVSEPSKTVSLLVNIVSENSPLDIIKVCNSLYIPGTHIPFLLIEWAFFTKIGTGCTALSKFCDFFFHSRAIAFFVNGKGTGPGSVSWALCRTGQYQDFFVYFHLLLFLLSTKERFFELI